MFNNYEKMKKLETADSVMEQKNDSSGTDPALDTETQTKLVIEDLAGQVEPTEKENAENLQVADNTAAPDNMAAPDNTAAPDSTSVPDSTTVPDITSDQAASASTQPKSEAEIILQQGYYIVQPGDSMISISKKIYQDASHVADLCAANGIENVDNIKVGEKLILP